MSDAIASSEDPSPATANAAWMPPSSPDNGHDQEQSVLKTIMALRNLDMSEESKFDFALPEGCRQWPGPCYGEQSPHTQFAKATKQTRAKRQGPQTASPTPAKASRPKTKAQVTKRKSRPEQPSKGHGPIPVRKTPLHLLNLPGEIRDMIYELLVVRDDPIYPQVRPSWKLGESGRGVVRIYRRYPQEPILALVNRQLRHEVLSTFYGINKFIFRKSRELDIGDLSAMTSPRTMLIWDPHGTSTRYLRNLQLKLEHARSALGSVKQSYTLRKTPDNKIKITHKLADPEYCQCVENVCIETVMKMIEDGTLKEDLVRVAAEVMRLRTAKLSALARKLEEGMFWMPGVLCGSCGRASLMQVSME